MGKKRRMKKRQPSQQRIPKTQTSSQAQEVCQEKQTAVNRHYLINKLPKKLIATIVGVAITIVGVPSTLYFYTPDISVKPVCEIQSDGSLAVEISNNSRLVIANNIRVSATDNCISFLNLPFIFRNNIIDDERIIVPKLTISETKTHHYYFACEALPAYAKLRYGDLTLKTIYTPSILFPFTKKEILSLKQDTIIKRFTTHGVNNSACNWEYTSLSEPINTKSPCNKKSPLRR
jgi:hypothetical protein